MNNTSTLPTGRILIGDATKRLAELPDESVDTVVTSPPYYRLRNYGDDQQIGLESTVDGWVDALSAVTDELARVLRPHGSLWLNLGDTYGRRHREGAPPKSLLGAPERLLLRLMERGWLVRNKVVWAKPNPMPNSVRDRLSCTWEPLYLLTRNQRYYFDLDAIRTPARSRLRRPTKHRGSGKYDTTPGTRPAWSGPLAGTNRGLPAMKAAGRSSHVLGKNPGDVWTVATANYRGAHFATFPTALAARPILATCPEAVCAACDLPWQRARTVQALGSLAVRGPLRKSCPCDERTTRPGVVLDPFMGAGTVAVVAERLGRRWLGIELNQAYAAAAEQRVAVVRAGGEERR